MLKLFCTYKIDLNQSQPEYLQALKSYGTKLKVSDIREMDLKPLKDLRKILSWNIDENDLPSVLKKMQEQGIQGQYTYTCESLNSESLTFVFPNLTLKPGPLHINKEPVAGWYLEGIIGEEVDDNRWIDPKEYLLKAKVLSRDEAIALIRACPCSGAIDLKGLKTLIFECGGTCFYLNYDALGVGCLPHLSFDLNHGFHLKLQRSTRHGDEERERMIASALDQYFLTWRDNNKYTGPLFPEAVSLDFKPQAVGASFMPQLAQEEKKALKQPLPGALGLFPAKPQDSVKNSSMSILQP